MAAVPSLPPTMRAVIMNEDFTVQVRDDVPLPVLTHQTALVKLHAAALNRRDYWIGKKLYPGIILPCILGSDGCGTIVAVHCGESDGAASHTTATRAAWIGLRVIINPGYQWGEDSRAQSPFFSVLGMPLAGTFAEYIAVPLEQLAEAPPHLSPVSAAALPLAGATAYRALVTQGGVRKGDRVLVTGIGGGVAVLVLQFALALGAEVWVTSSSPHKVSQALALGASGGALYTTRGWAKELKSSVPKGFNVIVDGGGGPDFSSLLGLLAGGGALVVYGATGGSIGGSIDVHRVFLKQLRLLGSTMASEQEFRAMVELVNEHRIEPVIDSVRPLEEVVDALSALENSLQMGKLVLKIADDSTVLPSSL